MKATILSRLKRLEEARAIENLPPVEFQTGYLKSLPAEYTGERHIVTLGRDADGLYQWEERRGPEPNEAKRNSVPLFRVILTSVDDEHPAPEAQPR